MQNLYLMEPSHSTYFGDSGGILFLRFEFVDSRYEFYKFNFFFVYFCLILKRIVNVAVTCHDLISPYQFAKEKNIIRSRSDGSDLIEQNPSKARLPKCRRQRWHAAAP
jgi:hypothetical protein